MKIEYRWFTAEQSQSLLSKGDLSSEIEKMLRKALKSAQNELASDFIALLALSGKDVAGSILFTYGHISTPDEIIRVAAGQALYTNPEFRGLGVATTLISKSLEIGIPCFYTGISAQAMPLYERLGFSFIDQSPIYQMPISSKGILREWRNRLGRINNAEQKPFKAVTVLNEILEIKNAALKKAPVSNLTALKADLACSTTDELMKTRHSQFQVPWNRDSMINAANGDSSKFRLLVLKNTSTAGQSAHFITIYKKVDHVRLPLTSRQLDLINGLVNEIYPPPETDEIAIDILSTLATNARAWGFDNLAFCAMTPSLEDACQSMGLNSYHCKVIAIQPIGMGEGLATSILKSENWWCRAITEDYLEEAK